MAEEDVDLLISEVVFSELEDILCIQREAIRLEDHIVHDLNADGDDLSFCFIPRVEQRLGLKLTQQDWNETGTVQSVLQMLKKCKSQIQLTAISSTYILPTPIALILGITMYLICFLAFYLLAYAYF